MASFRQWFYGLLWKQKMIKLKLLSRFHSHLEHSHILFYLGMTWPPSNLINLHTCNVYIPLKCGWPEAIPSCHLLHVGVLTSVLVMLSLGSRATLTNNSKLGLAAIWNWQQAGDPHCQKDEMKTDSSPSVWCNLSLEKSVFHMVDQQSTGSLAWVRLKNQCNYVEHRYSFRNRPNSLPGW